MLLYAATFVVIYFSGDGKLIHGSRMYYLDKGTQGSLQESLRNRG